MSRRVSPETTRQPETMHQATRWDRHAVRHEVAGLCRRCSAQAAWGHSLGFSQVQAPCSACAPAVASFPVAATGAWRKLPNNGLSAAQLCIAFPPMSADPDSSRRTSTAPEGHESATSDEEVQP
jgi:hypothetical protein